jgi:hypothetical protein
MEIRKKYTLAAMPARFDPEIVEELRKGKILGIRAGTAPHRFTGVWMVLVQGRLFVRSWSLKPRSWWRTFLEEPRGAVTIGARELAVRAVQTRSERLKDAVSEAYAKKYSTPASKKWVRGFRAKRRRDTTTELVPA